MLDLLNRNNICTGLERGNKFRLKDHKVVALVDHEFNDLELWYPVLRLREEGAQVDLVGPKSDMTM